MLGNMVSFEFNPNEMQQINSKKWFRSVAQFSYPFVIPLKDIEVFQTLQRLVQVLIVPKYSGVFHRKVLSSDSHNNECENDRKYSVRVFMEEAFFPSHASINPFSKTISTINL